MFIRRWRGTLFVGRSCGFEDSWPFVMLLLPVISDELIKAA